MKKRWLSMMREQFQYNNETYVVLDVLSIKNMDFVIYQNSLSQYAYLKRNDIEERMTYTSFETLIKVLPQYQGIGYQNIKNMLDAYVRVLNEKENMVSLKRMFWEVLERDQEYFEPNTNQVLSFEYFETLFQTESYSYFGKNVNKVHHLDASVLEEKSLPLEEKKSFFTIPHILYAALAIFILISFNGFFSTFSTNKNHKKLGDYILLNTDLVGRLEPKQEQEVVEEKNYWKDITISTTDVDFESLKKETPSIIGWFFLNNTEINYPISQEKNNLKDQTGWLLSDENSDFVNFKNNTFIYSDSKLNFLTDENISLLDEEWYSKEENQLFVISTSLQNTVWKIVSINITNKEKSELVKMYQEEGYINTTLSKSIYDYKETLTAEDKTLILVIPIDSKDTKIIISAKMVQSRKNS